MPKSREEEAAYMREYRRKHKDELEAKRRVYIEKNRDVVAARLRSYQGKHKEEIAAQRREHYTKNKEAISAYKREHYLRNRDSIKLKSKRYFATDEGKAVNRESARRRVARKRNADGAEYTTDEMITSRCDVWGNRCYICGGPMEAIDHVKPLAKGGAHLPCNLRPICKSCNSHKKDCWPYKKAQIGLGYPGGEVFAGEV